MKKNYALLHFYLTIISILFLTQSYGQSWLWGISGGSYTDIQNENESVTSIVTDTEGNIYILSHVGYSNLQIDGLPKEANYSTANNSDLLLASFDCNGSYRWSRIIGSIDGEQIDRMLIDENNDIYLAGRMFKNSNVYFRGENNEIEFTLPASSSFGGIDSNYQSLYLFKYNSSGDLLWVTTPHEEDVSILDANSYSKSIDFTLDEEGNVYWLCTLPTGTYADGGFSNTSENRQGYVLQYNSEGNFVKSTPLDFVTDWNYPYFFFKRNPINGNYYISGSVLAAVNPPIINGNVLTKNMFLLAYDKDGNFLWEKLEEEGPASIKDMEIDSSGYIYISGSIKATNLFGGIDLTSGDTSGYITKYISKLSANGDLIWTNNPTIQSSYPLYDITIKGNNVLVAGYENGIYWDDFEFPTVTNGGKDPFFARFDIYTGEVLDIQVIESAYGLNSMGYYVGGDQRNNIYLGGHFDQALYVNEGNTLTENAKEDLFLAKFGTNNCDCQLPQEPNFTITENNTNSFTFNYSEVPDYDTITWDFGNGDYSSEDNPTYSYLEAGDYNITATVTNECGYAQYSRLINIETLRTEEITENEFKIHPNPANHIIKITSSQLLEKITVFDTNGRSLKRIRILSKNYSLDISDLSGGFYLLEIESDNKKTIKKFIKN